MCILASDNTAIASIILGQSLSLSVPVFIFFNSTLDCEDNIRCTNCSLDISKLNTATEASPFKAAF